MIIESFVKNLLNFPIQLYPRTANQKNKVVQIEWKTMKIL